MAKFKVGDRVRIIEFDCDEGGWCRRSINKIGTVTEESCCPWVRFDDGFTDCGSEIYLYPVEEPKKDEGAPKTETQPLTVNVSIGAELTHITIGGKRFRLVPED